MKKRMFSLVLLIALVLALCPVQSYAATIDTVSLSITVPAAGKTPDYNPVLPAGAGCYSADYTGVNYKNDVFWIDTATGTWLTVDSSTFAAGSEYTVVIYLTPVEGNSFSDTTKGYINGYEVDTALQGDGQIRLSCSFMVKLNGWQKQDGNYYYYKDGTAVTGWQKIDGKYYCFDSAGVLRIGFVKDGGKYYYLSKTDGSLQTGFVKDGGKYYYFSKTDGTLQIGFVKDSGKYYYFSKTDGTMQFGFVKEGGYYYFSKTNGSMQFGFVKDGGKYYYFSKSNGLLQYEWVKDSGNYYYFHPTTGVIQTGWLEYGGKIYYLSPSTGALQTGWVKDGGNYYYMDPATAVRQTGWLDYGGKRYYLNPSTGAVLVGWLKIGYYSYYLQADGTMATGTVNIDGYDFIFGSDGIMQGLTEESQKRATFLTLIDWIGKNANANYDGYSAYKAVTEIVTYYMFYDALEESIDLICEKEDSGILYKSILSFYLDSDYSDITLYAEDPVSEDALFYGTQTVLNTAFSASYPLSFSYSYGPLDAGVAAIICRDSLVGAVRWLDHVCGLQVPYNGLYTHGARGLGFVLIGAAG